jgi:hypothetical protein
MKVWSPEEIGLLRAVMTLVRSIPPSFAQECGITGEDYPDLPFFN